MKQYLKVACIQMACKPGNVFSNMEKGKKFIKEAKAQGAEIVVLPELFNVGYDLDVLKSMQYDCAETIAQLLALSRELGIYIAAGVVETENNKLYNSVVVFNNKGEQVCKYRKVNLFPLSKEKGIFEEGEEAVTFSIDGFKMGIMICYDIRFPELSRKYLDLDCSALIVVSAFPFPRLDHWRTLLNARAIENQMYVIASNRTGKDAEFWFAGNSCIIDPWGTVKATLNETEEGVILHEISLDKINEVRTYMPCLQNKVRLDSMF